MSYIYEWKKISSVDPLCFCSLFYYLLAIFCEEMYYCCHSSVCFCRSKTGGKNLPRIIISSIFIFLSRRLIYKIMGQGRIPPFKEKGNLFDFLGQGHCQLAKACWIKGHRFQGFSCFTSQSHCWHFVSFTFKAFQFTLNCTIFLMWPSWKERVFI